MPEANANDGQVVRLLWSYLSVEKPSRALQKAEDKAAKRSYTQRFASS